ncbi:MAG: Asp-tRNA(Asn)/Glu-tRNA(Gln) amidotransferase GatCAB subunit B, partial [Syntrophales bacterium]|nr:Asp-tRNA(Asn)/Glu-tRNA(Gln) amidotransferase GatCAB subunit B [Syntrophales bacterium]
LEKRDRFLKEYQLTAYDAGVLTSSRAMADYYEEVVKLSGRPKIAANWVMGDVLRLLNEDGRDIKSSPVSPASLAEMIKLIEAGTISGKMAKEIVEEMYKSGKPPQAVIKEKGMVQLTDEEAIAEIIAGVMAANPAQLAQYRSGKDKLFGFFVGQVMKATQGKANPQIINELLNKML